MMKINFITYLIFFLFCLSALAANTATDSTLEILQNNLPEHCNFSGEFIQIRKLQGLPNNLQSSGDFFFTCKHGLIWKTRQPINETRIYTTYHAHFNIDDTEEVFSLSSIADFHLAKFLLNTLSGNANKLLSSYDINIENDTSLIVTLIPRNKYLRKGLTSIQLLKHNTSIDVKITDANQQVTQISIKEKAQYPSDKIIKTCDRVYGTLACDILKNPAEYEQDLPD